MRGAIIFLLLLMMSGCATTYQSRGFSGGYSETQLDTNVYIVTFNGNGYTSPERVADFTLLRSAELTIESGYKYFAIVDGSSYSSQSMMTTPTTTYTNFNSYGGATSTSYGGNSFIIRKPSSSNTIVMLDFKPGDTMVYNAEFIVRSLKEKYEIE